MTNIVDRLRAGEPCSEAGDRCKVMNGPSGCLCAIAAAEITRLRTALAASEAKLEKARDALRAFVVYVHDDVRNSTDAFKLIRSRENGGGKLFAENFRLAATTLKDITQ